MKGSEKPTVAQKSPRWIKPLVTVLALAFAGVFIWSQLPSGAYPTDLSRIGQGRPALVLAYDPNYAGGGRVMEVMNTIRGDYADRMDFFVAHLGDPQGQAFAERHSAADGSVVVFAADGAPVRRIHRPEDEQALRAVLDAVVAR